MAEQITSSNSKRLVNNTFSMYVRMLFLMFISFYTSRVVLQTLGTTDFGIYNIVGGIVVLFTFVNSAMTTGTQRHLSYELGKPDGNFNRIFSACMNIHIGLAILIVFFAETIGLWFLNNKMNFPLDRMSAVNWVYHFSVLSCVFQVIRVPYNAVIIAYERMSFYAYIGIFEGILKLIIVYMLSIGNYDKLIFYSILTVGVSVLVTIIFYLYCSTRYKELSYYNIHDRLLYKSLLSFSGWTIFGSLANIGRNQGMGIIINIFYGVTLNAAIGIANQVNAAICQFVTGFQQAFNPQLTKAEAQQDRESQIILINKTAKYSFLIILFFAAPVLFNLETLLTLWLGEYPPHSVEICFWIVVATLIDSLSGPLWVTIFAHGKIMVYQVVISVVLLLVLPITYFCGLLNAEPQISFAFMTLINLTAVAVRLLFLKHQISFSTKRFAKDVMLPITIVSTIIVVFTMGVTMLPLGCGLSVAVVKTSIVIIVEVFTIFLVGFTVSERMFIKSLIKNKLKNN